MFCCDNKCKRVLTADNVKEMDEIKVLQTTESVYTNEHGYIVFML